MTSTLADLAVFVTGAAGWSILVKATLLLSLGLAAAWIARRQRASIRHVLLAATFATLLALPLLALLAPAVSIELPVEVRPATAVSTATMPAGAPEAPLAIGAPPAPARTLSIVPSWTALAIGVWLGGAVLLTIAGSLELWRVRRIVRTGLPWLELRERVGTLAAEGGVHRAVDVLRHEDVAAPFVWGVWRPTVVLPAAAADWAPADLERALVHELEHVRRMDWTVQFAARLICASYWLHPLAWVAWRRLCLEAERACDDAVVQRAERVDYAEQLVSMAERMSASHAQPVLGMANRSDLSRRVAALLDARQRRGRAGAFAAASAITASVLAGGVVAPMRAVAVSAGPLPLGEGATAGQKSAAPQRFTGRLDVALYEAASEGDVDSILKLLDAGAGVNAAISGDGSPLIGAARRGHLDAVRLLLDRGAHVDMGVPGDGNALIMAAGAGHTAIVALLLDRGASIDLVVPGDENALITASRSGKLEAVKLLVSRGANVNARVWACCNRDDREWRTPLNMARRNQHAAVEQFLRSAGAVE
jgi:beta-lactamase regulating signal transducer with metallopeptidase domain